MNNQSIIKQGIDICVKQIDYIEFGLKQSEDTPYLVCTINIINNLLPILYDIDIKDRQNLIPLINKIGINT